MNGVDQYPDAIVILKNLQQSGLRKSLLVRAPVIILQSEKGYQVYIFFFYLAGRKIGTQVAWIPPSDSHSSRPGRADAT